jgi:hypothetical protein
VQRNARAELVPGRKRPAARHSALHRRPLELLAKPSGNMLRTWWRRLLRLPWAPLLNGTKTNERATQGCPC